MLLIHLPWKCFSSSKIYSLLIKTLDKEFERKNVSPVTRLQKYIALNSNRFKKETSLKLLKKKPEIFLLKIKVQYWRYSFISRLPCWQIAPVLPSFQQPHALALYTLPTWRNKIESKTIYLTRKGRTAMCGRNQ